MTDKDPKETDKDFNNFPKKAEDPMGKLQASILSEEHINMDQLPPVNLPLRPLESITGKSELFPENRGAYTRIYIGQHTFNCNPTLLICYSLWFSRRDWRTNTFRFSPEELPPNGFENAYNWMRLEKPPTLDTVAPMLQVAKHLGIVLLEEICWQLLSEDKVRENIGFQVYLQARFLPDCQDVRELMMSRVHFYFLALVGQEHFENLSIEELVDLLKRHNIGVNSEVEVFFAVQIWINKAPNERLKHLNAAINCVRFSQLPLMFLLNLRNACNHENKNMLFKTDPMMLKFHSDPRTLIMLQDALTLIGTRCQSSTYDTFLSECNKQPRNWVYHPLCKYHQKSLRYPYDHTITATEFKNFLETAQLEWMGDEQVDDSKRCRDVDIDDQLTLQTA